MATINRPHVDPELLPLLQEWTAKLGSPKFTEEKLHLLRQPSELSETPASPDPVAAAVGGAHQERTIPGLDGTEIPVSIFYPPSFDPSQKHPGIVYYHGGGMFAGNRWSRVVSCAVPWVKSCNAVLITPEYRLTPENQSPTPIYDGYATLLWVAHHLSELGIDSDRLLVAGSSAGACVCAGAVLLARERGGPRLCGQLLNTPMLDDRSDSVSMRQFDGDNDIFGRKDNLFGWRCALGRRLGGPDVENWEVPGRISDLSGLPPTFIDVGSAEAFRDDAVAYASKCWASGVQAELHVWAGGYHGFDLLVPKAMVSKAASEARNQWVRRTLKAE